MSFDDAAVVTVGGKDYRTHFWVMNEGGPLNRMKNSDLKGKNDKHDGELH